MKYVWIPEAPEHPGLYANKSGTDLDTGKIQGLKKQPSTMSPNHALQFETREECQAWCDANPHPVFVPREHGFGNGQLWSSAGAVGVRLQRLVRPRTPKQLKEKTMRPATLYTLNATEILAGDYHRMIRSNLRPIFTTNPNEAIAPMVDHFAVPIHRVSRCIKPKTAPLHTDPWHHEYEDVFFGLEPALAEILEAPFQAKLNEAQAKLTERIAAFNRLPWWRRVWMAFNRAV